MRRFLALLIGVVVACLSTSEVEAQANLALGKPAQQSSTYSGPYQAAKGVDGNRASMFHTNAEPNAWWQVDLQGNFALGDIVLHNRVDGYRERARRVTVLLSGDGRTWDLIYRHDGKDFSSLRVDAGGRNARYVRVQLAESNYLHLAEVEVYGKGTSSSIPPPPPPPPPSPAGSLTGAWVHSYDPNFKNHDSKVIVIQDGNQVTMTRAGKYNNRWIVSVCRGRLSDNKLRTECNYVSGGNPFGFGATVESWVVSQDGNHLDGTIEGRQESHYSRIP